MRISLRYAADQGDMALAVDCRCCGDGAHGVSQRSTTSINSWVLAVIAYRLWFLERSTTSFSPL